MGDFQMRFEFRGMSPQQVEDRVEDYIEENGLPLDVELDSILQTFTISISRFGTSTFTFLVLEEGGGDEPRKVILDLTEQSIAFLHKSYVEDFKDQLIEAVESLGGEVFL